MKFGAVPAAVTHGESLTNPLQEREGVKREWGARILDLQRKLETIALGQAILMV